MISILYCIWNDSELQLKYYYFQKVKTKTIFSMVSKFNVFFCFSYKKGIYNKYLIQLQKLSSCIDKNDNMLAVLYYVKS